MKLRLGQSGDTIMEVMICTTIVGMVLTSAFSLSNSNQNTTRSAQERTVATGIAEAQLEKLRTYLDSQRTLPPAQAGKAFCFKDNATTPQYFDRPVADANQEQDPANKAKYTLMVGAEDKGCNEFTNPALIASQYRYAIWERTGPDKYPGANPGINAYAITVRWDAPTGNGVDQIEMYYEVYNNNAEYVVEGATEACRDNFDNDGDGVKDFKTDGTGDPGCDDATDTSEVNPACNNGLDDDDDGKTDAQSVNPSSYDPGCTSGSDPSELGSAQCDDGINNDGEAGIDYRTSGGDPECTSLTDNTEKEPACRDGEDNDGDLLIDFPKPHSSTHDPGCDNAADSSEFHNNRFLRYNNFGNHYYTITPNRDGYTNLEGDIGYLSPNSRTGLVPVYHVQQGTDQDFYTHFASERDLYVNSYGFTDKGIEGYMVNKGSNPNGPCPAGMANVYHAYNPSGTDHFYTNSEGEWNSANFPGGWTNDRYIFGCTYTSDGK